MGRCLDKSIYAIQHNVTKRVYVGTSMRVEQRIREHIGHLRHHNHINPELQKDYDLYGEDYSYFLLETGIGFMDCFDREYEWMCILNSNVKETGYNLGRKYRPRKLESFEKINVKIGKMQTHKRKVKEFIE